MGDMIRDHAGHTARELDRVLATGRNRADVDAARAEARAAGLMYYRARAESAASAERTVARWDAARAATPGIHHHRVLELHLGDMDAAAAWLEQREGG